MIVAAGVQDLLAPVMPSVEGPLPCFGQERWHRPAVGGQALAQPSSAQPVDQLEGAEFPVVPQAHGLIHGGRVVGNLRHQTRSIGKRAGQDRPGVSPAAIVVRDQCRQTAPLGRGHACEFGFSCRAVLTRLEVQRLLDLLGTIGLQPVEPALALAAGVALGDQLLDQLGRAMDFVERVALGQGFGHAGEHVWHQVQTDHIQEPEDTGLGDPHRPADDGIGLFDG